MRIFELSTRLTAVNRSEGRSATSAAAYRAGCEIECEREGKRHDYTRKGGIEATKLVLPDGADSAFMDRSKLWNAAEFAERNGKRAKREWKEKATVAREIFFSLPHELSPAGRQQVAHTIACHLAEVHGVAVDFALHLPGREGDERNFHCHMLFTTRRVGAEGFGQKTREWDDRKTGPKLTKQLRAFIAQTQNDALKAEGKGHLVKVEHRKFSDRGISQAPTRHQGPNRTHQLRNRQRAARRHWAAELAAQMSERHEKEIAALRVKADFTAAQEPATAARREAEATAQVRQWLQAEKVADIAPTGFRALFLKATGRGARDAFEREARHAELEKTAAARIEAIKKEIAATVRAGRDARQAELAAVQARHTQERAGIRDQIKQRIKLDLAAERTERREQTRPRDHQQEGGRSLSM